MPKRQSIADRMAQEQQEQPSGQEAIYRRTRPTVHRQPSTVDGKWEETHQRVTFYCPRDLLAAIEAYMQRTGRSKTAVIVDALREHLAERPRRRSS